MNANQRREEILSALNNAAAPLSASTLASKFNVSRQIIVGDVSVLRAAGHPIEATTRGYVLTASRAQFPFIGTVVCRHTNEDMESELTSIVDNGATCIDVVVDHAIYGELTGKLDISSRYDVNTFCQKVMESDDQPLSIISGGLHMHRIGCANREVFERVVSELRSKGFLEE